MANITCPQCKRFVDDTTKVCPGCKFNIKKYVKDMKKKGMSVGSSLSLNGVYSHSTDTNKFVPELDFLKGANNAPQLDFTKNTAPAATPELDFEKNQSAAPAAASPELDFIKKQNAAAAAPAAQPVRSKPPVDVFAPPIPQAPVNRSNVSAVNPADVFSEKPAAPRQAIAPAPAAPAMSQAAQMAAYQQKREAQAAAQAAASYAARPAAPVAPQPTAPVMSQAAQMAAYQEKREAATQIPTYTPPQPQQQPQPMTQPLPTSALSRPVSSPTMVQSTIQPVFESASLNAGVLNGGGALSGVLSGPTIMEKIAAEKRLAKENESIFESASLRKAEKELKAGTRQAAGGLHGDLPLDAYRDNGVARFGEASEYQRQMAAHAAQGAAGGASVPPYAAQQPAQNPYGQAAPYAQQPAATAAPGGLNPMFAAPQSNNPLFGGGAPQAPASPYSAGTPGAPNGLLAQPQASANPLYGGAPAGNPMFSPQTQAPTPTPAAPYQPVQQQPAVPYQPVQQQPAAPYQPVQQQPAAPVGYQPVQQAGAPAGVFTGATGGSAMFGSQPAGGGLYGTQPAAPQSSYGQAPGQPVGNPYGG
ncbi:MAG: hypothetical protein IKO10_02925 [Lachnospiraceae bacterium]|nr:hypothetical protein [Lachnospiraceae bacterium]